MKHPRIKICGITRLKDARLVADLGADYIGVIFHRASPRFVTIERALKIRQAVGPLVQIAAVFVNDRPERIISICRKLQCSMVQLHGSESNQIIKLLQKAGLKVARAFYVTSESGWKDVRETIADFALVDNQTASLAGGSGQTFDWNCAPERPVPNLILSGGLNVRNFSEGIKLFIPAILDFNSGVEDSPGKKSERKLRQLFRIFNKLSRNTR